MPENPRKAAGESRTLTKAQKAEARGRARAAGRKYPNRVDNMAVARKAGAKKAKAKKAKASAKAKPKAKAKAKSTSRTPRSTSRKSKTT